MVDFSDTLQLLSLPNVKDLQYTVKTKVQA